MLCLQFQHIFLSCIHDRTAPKCIMHRVASDAGVTVGKQRCLPIPDQLRSTFSVKAEGVMSSDSIPERTCWMRFFSGSARKLISASGGWLHNDNADLSNNVAWGSLMTNRFYLDHFLIMRCPPEKVSTIAMLISCPSKTESVTFICAAFHPGSYLFYV